MEGRVVEEVDVGDRDLDALGIEEAHVGGGSQVRLRAGMGDLAGDRAAGFVAQLVGAAGRSRRHRHPGGLVEAAGRLERKVAHQVAGAGAEHLRGVAVHRVDPHEMVPAARPGFRRCRPPRTAPSWPRRWACRRPGAPPRSRRRAAGRYRRRSTVRGSSPYAAAARWPTAAMTKRGAGEQAELGCLGWNIVSLLGVWGLGARRVSRSWPRNSRQVELRLEGAVVAPVVMDPSAERVLDRDFDLEVGEAGGEDPVAGERLVAGVEHLDHQLDVVVVEEA